MRKTIMLVGVLVFMCFIVSPPKLAYAHFIIEDTSTGVKALFHITPDHNPIAGKNSVVSFDFSKTGLTASNYTYELNVVSPKFGGATVPVEVIGNVILANYTFPSQGFYNIRLTVIPKKDGPTSNLKYGQRVSRGVIKNEAAFGPLTIGAISGTLLIAVIAVILSFKDSKRKGRSNDESIKK